MGGYLPRSDSSQTCTPGAMCLEKDWERDRAALFLGSGSTLAPTLKPVFSQNDSHSCSVSRRQVDRSVFIHLFLFFFFNVGAVRGRSFVKRMYFHPVSQRRFVKLEQRWKRHKKELVLRRWLSYISVEILCYKY